MRLIITLLTILGSTAALAGPLPINGSYCGSEGLRVTSETIAGNEECRFTKITETGPTWFIVAMRCETDDTNYRLRVAVSPDKKSIAVTYPDNPSEVERLHRCN